MVKKKTSLRDFVLPGGDAPDPSQVRLSRSAAARRRGRDSTGTPPACGGRTDGGTKLGDAEYKAKAAQPKLKLKRARGALLGAINSGRVPPPPGYEGPQS